VEKVWNKRTRLEESRMIRTPVLVVAAEVNIRTQYNNNIKFIKSYKMYKKEEKKKGKNDSTTTACHIIIIIMNHDSHNNVITVAQ
jgi:hypothetical protein